MPQRGSLVLSGSLAPRPECFGGVLRERKLISDLPVLQDMFVPELSSCRAPGQSRKSLAVFSRHTSQVLSTWG